MSESVTKGGKSSLMSFRQEEQGVGGWRGQVLRAESRVSDQKSVGADPKERSWSHVKRAFVTVTSSNA